MDRLAEILPRLRNNVAFKYTFCIGAFLVAFVIRLALDLRDPLVFFLGIPTC